MINHNSATPKYIQLAEDLEKQIQNGTFKADERLYSENELCQKYDVSRITVRQALRLLESKGLIYTVHGKGTFVKLPVLSQDLPQIVSFNKMLSLNGLAGHTQIESFTRDLTCVKAMEVLHVQSSKNLTRLNLIASVENSPVAFYESFFTKAVGEEMHACAENMAASHLPFTTFDLYSKLGITLGYAEQSISAEIVDKALVDILHVPQGSALVVLESVFYDAEGKALEYKIGRYRSDIYSFKLTRTF